MSLYARHVVEQEVVGGVSRPSVFSGVVRIVSPLSDGSVARLFVAAMLSQLGDWAARLALGILVFRATDSPLATAAVTTVSLLPWLGFGQLLGTLADRYPHRAVMVYANLFRAAVYAALALLDLPVGGVLALAFVAGLADPPFEAAHSATLPQIAKERYTEVLTLFTGGSQIATLIGFSAGGFVAGLASPSIALLVNAATFVAVVPLYLGVTPTRSSEPGDPRGPLIRPAIRALTSDRIVVVPVAVVTAAALGGVAIESLMVVYAAHLGYGATGTGVLAMVPAIAAMVAAVFVPSGGRHTSLVRTVCKLVVTMNVVSLVVYLVDAPVPFVLIGFLAAGALDVLTVPAGAVIGERLPQAQRGTAFSFLQGSMGVVQAVGALAAGALATLASPPVAAAALTAPSLLVGVLGLRLVRRERGRHAAAADAERIVRVPSPRATETIAVPAQL